MIHFLKMHGLGNDFVILDGRVALPELSPECICRMADRRFGVGCDQLIVMTPSSRADVGMHIYNPDASMAGACGNATRCVASLLMEETGSDAVTIETLAGVLSCWREGAQVRVDMGPPRLAWQEIPLVEAMDTLDVRGAVCVSMGNPHAVYFVSDVAAVLLEQEGPLREHDPLFPERTNVEFVEVLDRTTLKVRVWERGAGVTLACGSGACAVAVAAVRRGLTERRLTVKMDGGDLQLEWREQDGHVLMTGPVQKVFSGEFDPE